MAAENGALASARDFEALRWVSEQQAARVDQVARAIGRSERTAQRWAKRMQSQGLIEARRVLGDEPAWTWLTPKGQRVADTGFRPWKMSVGKLHHLAAVNEVRLYVAERSPASEWTCERRLAQERENRTEHLPDAVVHTDGQRHAIEVELTQKASRRMAPILDELARRFDVVLFFCSRPVRRQLEELAATGRWPKLAVRDVPRPTTAITP